MSLEKYRQLPIIPFEFISEISSALSQASNLIAMSMRADLSSKKTSTASRAKFLENPFSKPPLKSPEADGAFTKCQQTRYTATSACVYRCLRVAAAAPPPTY